MQWWIYAQLMYWFEKNTVWLVAWVDTVIFSLKTFGCLYRWICVLFTRGWHVNQHKMHYIHPSQDGQWSSFWLYPLGQNKNVFFLHLLMQVSLAIHTCSDTLKQTHSGETEWGCIFIGSSESTRSGHIFWREMILKRSAGALLGQMACHMSPKGQGRLRVTDLECSARELRVRWL
jgi:hypothetical protein